MSTLFSVSDLHSAAAGNEPLFLRVGGGRALRAAVTFALLCGCGEAAAQSMEERLRTQLRTTAAELAQARSQLSQLPAAEQARDQAQAEATTLRGQLAAAQQRLDGADASNRALARQAQQVADQANTRIAQTKAAYDELTRTAQAKETERAQAQQLATALQAQNQACIAKNAQLYAVSNEILAAYERVGRGRLFAARQPFAAKARVKLENAAQAYGDRLYGQRCDLPVAAAAPQDAPSAPTPQAPTTLPPSATETSSPSPTPAATSDTEPNP